MSKIYKYLSDFEYLSDLEELEEAPQFEKIRKKKHSEAKHELENHKKIKKWHRKDNK